LSPIRRIQLQMPKYNYHCNSCDISFEEVHLMSEMVNNCKACESEDINRIPYGWTKPHVNTKRKTGDVVKEFIEKEKEELKKQKESLST